MEFRGIKRLVWEGQEGLLARSKTLPTGAGSALACWRRFGFGILDACAMEREARERPGRERRIR